MTITVPHTRAELVAPVAWPEPDTDQQGDLQVRAAALLLDLVSAKDLPRASWSISDINPGTLRGQIFVRSGDGHDDLIRERVTRWAEVFEVQATDYFGGFPQFRAVADLEGVTVEIWGSLSDTARKDAA